jgi:hypothetical protein
MTFPTEEARFSWNFQKRHKRVLLSFLLLHLVSLALFLKESTEENKLYQYFMQKNAMVPTANSLMDTLEDMAS